MPISGHSGKVRALVDWAAIDTVLLDMDGTLLDLNFDNHFWQTHLPLRYAEARGMAPAAGREELMARYHGAPGRWRWYSVDFWEPRWSSTSCASRKKWRT
jgi:FMN phosphatase YigB (HAD superfamily)